jgi:Acyl-CoA reductase (LuxC)
MTPLVAPALVRGQTICSDLISFGGRGGGSFTSPDPQRLLDVLPLRDPRALRDLHELEFDEIVEYLAELGRHLELSENEHLQEALACSEQWADLTAPLMRASFEQLPSVFAPDTVRAMAEQALGAAYLDGWVDRSMPDGRVVSIRAMGARAIHIVAGNNPIVAALSIVRNAIARSDAIIKTPSNDPLTALAIARTMAEFAPDHPVTRHVSVAYWKGGDTAVEERLYDPRNVEKILAWGGLASVRHVVRYLRPGLELITLDPKRSASIVGREALHSDATLREVARRTATDIGAGNQLLCLSARVIYLASGLDPMGIERANTFGQAVYDELQRLPATVSTKAKHFDPELRASIEALRSSREWYRVYGGLDGEGAVIVSQLDEPVGFHRTLSARVANVVPVDDPADALPRISAATQTIGIYPESLKTELRDVLALHGAQRLTTLGYAADPHLATPQDGIEPLRRMSKWIVSESCDPQAEPGMREFSIGHGTAIGSAT